MNILLRFLDLLNTKTIKGKLENIRVILPHPAVFALHKLLIAQRRQDKKKAEKDKRDALIVINNLLKNNEKYILLEIYKTQPKKWQKLIAKSLQEENELDVLNFLKSV